MAPSPRPRGPDSELELAGLCAALGAARVAGLSDGERQQLARAPRADRALVAATARTIADGGDPLGAWFCALRTPATRRARGATYTPPAIVAAMLAWARSIQPRPARVVDPGAGSARFLIAAGRSFPDADLLGVELDPLAALMARANLAAAGLASRAAVHCGDYRAFALAPIAGPTLFVGNPPYVRHHGIDRGWKQWLSERAARHGLRASQLAGLHLHFFVATLERARAGDVGSFVTAGEWLDVNYGALLRALLVGPLGLERLDVIDPRLAPFADAQTTAVISGFRVGGRAPTVRVRKLDRLEQLASLAGGEPVAREQLAAASRWGRARRVRPSGGELVELGELCRVHRGQVTGANAVWLVGPDTPPLPSRLLRPAVTRARELFEAGGALCSDDRLQRVIELPAELDALSASDRGPIETFLAWARAAGAHRAYVARHRSPWWSVKLRAPAPILATYMARRPPAFVRNLAGARHINIAHGLYPREPMPDASLDALARYLARSVSTDDGRTYAGGLTKFEPREMERLLVPVPAALAPTRATERTSPATSETSDGALANQAS